MSFSFRQLLLAVILPGLLLVPVLPAAAGIRHELTVRLVPDKHLLEGRDEVSLSKDIAGAEVSFSLAPVAEIRAVTINGAPAEYRSDAGRVQVAVPPEERGSSIELGIDYAAVFDDPVPDAPANMDNPGFGVTGIVSRKGTFLLGGAGWYPRFSGRASAFSIAVKAPKGVIAVTAGRSAGLGHEQGHTLSFWKVGRPVGPLALSAGRFIIAQDSIDGIQVATYFLPENKSLSKDYLAAVKRSIRMYNDLFGPYPFEKFAVVENFFPTGYGFPSFTLIGGRVLRLPFILESSLGHEIAHCWWGNGVRVDYSMGNWSEGLTTYVADHLFRERESAQEAREYRRQWLRNYALLVDQNHDFPLSGFESRTSPVSKVIGYDKSAMVFHMLRTMLGNEAFWSGLRAVYVQKRFEKASWQDFRQAFAAVAGPGLAWDLDRFFEQWVRRDGAPLLALQGVSRQKTAGGWKVSGLVVQQQVRPHHLPVELKVETREGSHFRTLALLGKETAFSVSLQAGPKKVELDPQIDVFRRLHPEEIPASVNSIKGAGSVSLVVAEGAGQAGKETARMLVQSLGLSRARIVPEAELKAGDPDSPCLVFIGLPSDPAVLLPDRKPLRLLPDGFRIHERVFDRPTDTLFGVFEQPGDGGKTVGLLYPVHPEFGPLVARKATHYGRYSYLAFRKGENQAKGTWPATESPLIVDWRD